MDSNAIIKQVKGLLIKAIERFSKKSGISSQVTGIMISAKNEQGDAKLILYSNMMPLKEIYVSDLYSSFDPIVMLTKTFGYDVTNLTVEWLKKFILKASNDFGYDVITPTYYLFIQGNELYAVMYVGRKQVKFSETRSDIPIEYILETK